MHLDFILKIFVSKNTESELYTSPRSTINHGKVISPLTCIYIGAKTRPSFSFHSLAANNSGRESCENELFIAINE